MLKANFNLLPNRLDKKFIGNLIEDLKEEVLNTNKMLFNKTLEAEKNIDKTLDMIRSCNRRILSKAWRSVKMSNKDVPKLSFRDRRQLPDSQQQETRHIRREDEGRSLQRPDREMDRQRI